MAVKTPVLLPMGGFYNKVNWLPAEALGSSVGSVLVYRSNESNGTFSIIATTAPTNNYYVDEGSGQVGSFYQIRFWDGVASSQPSNKISYESWDVLTDIDSVKRIARINDASDLASAEIYEAVRESTDEVYGNYGRPVVRSQISLSSGSTTYDFQLSYKPVYRVDAVKLFPGTSEFERVAAGSYTLDLEVGNITFTSAFVGSHTSRSVEIEYVPKVFNILATNMAGIKITESSRIIDGREIEPAEIKRMQRVVDSINEQLRPKGLWGSTQLGNEGDDDRRRAFFVDQDFP